MAYCPNCGSEIEEGKNFCAVCGKSVNQTDVQALAQEPKKKTNLVPCKKCGELVSKNAKRCPHCGAKLKHTGLIILGVLIGVIVISALFSEPKSESDKVNTSHEAVTSADAAESASVKKTEPKAVPQKTSFGIGEAAEFNDIIVTLESVEETNGANFLEPTEGNVFLLCSFLIDNQSSKDITVSSLMSFEAYCDDYSINFDLSATVSDSTRKQLDGSVAAGKKMSGIIGYQVPENWSELEIRFTPNFWSNKEITFTATK